MYEKERSCYFARFLTLNLNGVIHYTLCMQATRVLAIRHGETDWNVATRIQGQIDIALNSHGMWQAQQVAKALAQDQVHAIYSSDLSRAAVTAQHIAEHHQLPVRQLPGLRERHYGLFEGQTWADIQAAYPDDAVLWRDRVPNWTPANGGESLQMLHQRVANTLHQLCAEHLDQQIAVVTHGGVLDILYRMATGQDLQTARSWGLRNTAINRLLWTPQGLQLIGWADERHLEEVSRDDKSV